MNKTIVIKEVRIAFCDNLVKAGKATPESKARFGANFIIQDAAGLKLVQDTVAEIGKAEFNGKPPTGKDCSFRDGDTATDKDGNVYNGFEGKWFVAAYRREDQFAPVVVDQRKQKVQPGDEFFPRAGDYVNVKVQFYSQNGKNDKKNAYGKKINASLEAVQFVRRGESFGGSTPPTDDGFEEVPFDDGDDIAGM